ncbi:MAG: hypothetical protein ACM3WV_07040 [Bacillota bacterium]
MDWKGIRWERVALSLSAGLAVLFGAHFLEQVVRVEKPLKSRIMEIQGVSGVSWRREQAGYEMNLRLDENVSNLQDTVEKSVKLAEERLNAPVVSLGIKDKPDRKLLDAYYDQHFYLAEAAMLGNFGAMKKQVDSLARRPGSPQTKVYIGKEYLFIQMKDGAHYLYRIVERRQAGGAGTGGGNPA